MVSSTASRFSRAPPPRSHRPPRRWPEKPKHSTRCSVGFRYYCLETVKSVPLSCSPSPDVSQWRSADSVRGGRLGPAYYPLTCIQGMCRLWSATFWWECHEGAELRRTGDSSPSVSWPALICRRCRRCRRLPSPSTLSNWITCVYARRVAHGCRATKRGHDALVLTDRSSEQVYHASVPLFVQTDLIVGLPPRKYFSLLDYSPPRGWEGEHREHLMHRNVDVPAANVACPWCFEYHRLRRHDRSSTAFTSPRL